MAIYHQLGQMIDLKNRLDKKYGSNLIDKESDKKLDWSEVFSRVRFGINWETHEEFLREQEIIGGIPQIYFDIGEAILNHKPE